MELFLDSADVPVIEAALEMWHIDGITTNPRTIAETSRPFYEVIRDIGNLVMGTNKTVSVPTNPHNHNDYHKIVDQAHRLVDMNPNFVVKMPCTENGLKACQVLSEEGVRTHMNLCFTQMQALQAMRMGATFVSPFISWEGSTSQAARQFINDIMTIKFNYEFETEVLVAAVKTINHVADASIAGANIVTAAPEVYREALGNPLTSRGLESAQSAWDTIDFTPLPDDTKQEDA